MKKNRYSKIVSIILTMSFAYINIGIGTNDSFASIQNHVALNRPLVSSKTEPSVSKTASDNFKASVDGQQQPEILDAIARALEGVRDDVKSVEELNKALAEFGFTVDRFVDLGNGRPPSIVITRIGAAEGATSFVYSINGEGPHLNLVDDTMRKIWADVGKQITRQGPSPALEHMCIKHVNRLISDILQGRRAESVDVQRRLARMADPTLFPEEDKVSTAVFTELFKTHAAQQGVSKDMIKNVAELIEQEAPNFPGAFKSNDNVIAFSSRVPTRQPAWRDLTLFAAGRQACRPSSALGFLPGTRVRQASVMARQI